MRSIEPWRYASLNNLTKYWTRYAAGKHRPMKTRSATALTLLLSALFIAGAALPASKNIWSKDNLVAWCIVPFDIKERGPVERAEMLNGLGITKLAYDWRDKHIPTFDRELDALRSHHIQLQAFWLASGLDPAKDKNVSVVLDFLTRNHVRTQIWYLLGTPPQFDALPQTRKVEEASAAVRYVATEAAQLGCTVGLYNHGGWFGEPENELAILAALHNKNVGLVYNFNHAQQQIDRFPEFFPKIEPRLIALNLAGLKRGDPEIHPLSSDGDEVEMIRLVHRSKFRGPIGIINETTDPDAETGLRKNLDGLRQILARIGDNQSASTY